MKNNVIIGLGSNINADENIKKAILEIKNLGEIQKKSTFVETEPLVFLEQNNFINGVILLTTEHDFNELNKKLKEIEKLLGRIKTSNKNGPRTIDLDILIFNGKVIDKDVYERDFLKKTISEITDISF